MLRELSSYICNSNLPVQGVSVLLFVPCAQQVGEIVAYELDNDGNGVTLKIFIKSPYDKYVKSNTLFWHASGIDLTQFRRRTH